MSRTDLLQRTWKRETADRRQRAIAVAVLTACAGFVALWPYTSVIAAGSWSLASVAVIIIVAVTGLVVRQLRSTRAGAGAWSLIAQVIVAVLTVTLLITPQGALLGMIPTGATLSNLGRLATEAFQQVQYGTAPLEDTPALRAMLAIGFSIIAILVDQLIAQRITLLAAILIAGVGALPMIITLGDANIPWFVMLALLTLFLLRHSTRHDRTAPRHASTTVTIGVGAAAIVAALVITPVLPVSATWMGAGTSVQLNPSLRLGEDLRRPTPFTVITLATKDETAPYLRIASLSEFDGRTWAPDEDDVQPVREGFGEPDWTADIATVEQRTSVRVTGVSSSWLPVPYPATKITGVSPGWQIMPLNRTIVSEDRDASGEDYTVTVQSAEPTREQIQSAQATATSIASPDDLPAVIAETAREVTADALTDYDRLIALQNWFRSQFTYSLDAPVDGGFDGTGADAVAEFLDARSGYCIHFSGAFALMAQSLDLQVRIVVGYLPGQVTDEKRGEESIYTVSSDQLHAWPEVHFEGIGWIQFEPTASLGVPTDFQPAATDDGSVSDPTAPAPSAAPSQAPTTGPEIDEDQGDSASADGDTLQRLDPTPVVLVAAGVLVVLLMPAVIRLAIRLWRRSRARRGDAVMAWREVRSTLIDLNLPVSSADSPRTRGAQLVERGADAGAVRVLVTAIEQASYSRAAEDAGDLSTALTSVIASVRSSADARSRVSALLLPRSLFAADTTRMPALS